MLVQLLEDSGCGLGEGACDGGESGDAGSPLDHLLTDVGGLVGRGSNVAAQISGAGDHGESEVVEVCLCTLDHRGFNNEDEFGRFREVSPRRPRSL